MPNECQVANFRHSVRQLSFVFPDILLLYLFILPSIFIAISGLLHGVSKLGLCLLRCLSAIGNPSQKNLAKIHQLHESFDWEAHVLDFKFPFPPKTPGVWKLYLSIFIFIFIYILFAYTHTFKKNT